MTGSTRGEKSALVAHILGSRSFSGCPHASKEAKNIAASIRENSVKVSKELKRKQEALQKEEEGSEQPLKKIKGLSKTSLKAYNALEMPFSTAEGEAVRAQALRAVISANLAFRAMRNPEMLKLFEMLRKGSAAIIPSRKVIAGRLLSDAAELIEAKLRKVLTGKNIGLSFVTFQCPSSS